MTIKKLTCYNTIISWMISYQRSRKKKTKKEMAEKLSMSAAGWGKLEKGQVTLSAGNVLDICEILEISFTEFYFQVDVIKGVFESNGWQIERGLNREDDALYKIITTLKKTIETLSPSTRKGTLKDELETIREETVKDVFEAIREGTVKDAWKTLTELGALGYMILNTITHSAPEDTVAETEDR